jgi:hypothetical protein
MRLQGTGIGATIAGLTVLTGCGSPGAGPVASGTHVRVRPHVHIAALRQPAARPISLPRIKGGLPWPVVLYTNAGRYVIARDGVIRRLPTVHRAAVSHPAGFVWVNWPAHAWATVRAGHVEIVRNHRVLWRSARAYRVGTAGQMNTILTSPAGIAFQVPGSGPWYQARWQGPEHLAATSGWPDAWTRSGNLVAVQGNRASGHGYTVYSPSGTRVATLATGLNTSLLNQREVDPAFGTYWFLGSDQVLYRTDGVTVSRVADFTGFGADHGNTAALYVLPGGFMQMLSAGWRQGQVIFSPDGQVLARIPAPANLAAAGFGWVAVSPGRRALAYALYNEASGGATVFLVRPGQLPVAIYRTAHGASPCAASLSWHGSWLLYRAGRPVLVDTSGSRRVIRLPARLAVGSGRIIRVLGVHWR